MAMFAGGGCLVEHGICRHGESYPNKPVTLVVTAAPGGVTDILARAVGQRLGKIWGQAVIVENKPGASNQIGAVFVANSAPDGYTMLVTAEATFVINPWLYSKLPYDPVKDFMPITGLVSISQALITTPSLPVQNIKELIEFARKKPGELNYGTFGIGSTGHLNMEMLQTASGVKLVAVHYKGATPALTDVIAGNIQMMFINTSSAIGPWEAGRLKLLAVGSNKRLARFPDIPTAAENAASRASRPCPGSGCLRRAARQATSSPKSMPTCDGCSRTQNFERVSSTPNMFELDDQLARPVFRLYQVGRNEVAQRHKHTPS